MGLFSLHVPALWIALTPQSVQLNPRLATSIDPIRDFSELPGGRVLLASSESGVDELYLVPLSGGPHLRLSDAKRHGPVGEFQVDAPRGDVVYFARGSTTTLQRAPLTGTGPQALADTGAFPRSLALAATGESLYLTGSTGSRRELVSVPVGGGAPRRVHGPLASFASVLDFSIAPDGARVVFTGDLLVDRRVELFASQVDGSAPAIPLNPANSGSVGAFALSPTSERVAFEIAGTDLFSISIQGGPAVPLDSATAQESVGRFEFTPDGRWLVILADYASPGVSELFVAPADGSRAPERLSPVLVAGGSVPDFVLAPDGKVLFLADITTGRRALHEADPATRVLRRLSDGLPDEDVGTFELAPGGQRVVLSNVGAAADSWSIERANSRATQLLPFSPEFTLGAGHAFYFSDQDPLGAGTLVSLPLDGSHAPIELGPRLTRARLQPTRDGGQLLFLGDRREPHRHELFLLSATGGRARHLSPEGNAPERQVGAVASFDLTRDEKHVVYLADQELDGVYHVYGVDTEGSRSARRFDRVVPDGARVGLPALSPDDRHVLIPLPAPSATFRLMASPTDGSPARFIGQESPVHRVDPRGRWVVQSGPGGELLLASLDGLPTRLLSREAPDLATGIFTPDGERFLFRVQRAGGARMVSAHLSSGALTELTPSLPVGASVVGFLLSSRGRFVLVATDGTSVVPADGSAAPAPFTLPGALSIHPLRTSHDDSVAFLLADMGAGRFDLLRAPITGGPCVNLTARGPGVRANFRAELSADGRFLIGPSPTHALAAYSTKDGRVRALSDRYSMRFVLAPTGNTLYFVRPGSDGRGHLYSVSAAAGPARLLSGSIDVETAPDYGPFLELSPEGEWIGFRGRDQRLYIAPTSAGLEPLLVSELGPTEADFHLGRTQVFYLSLGSNGDGINLYGRPYGSLTTARR